MKEKVLITGSDGFIGKTLIRRLTGRYDIVQYDLKQGFDILNFEQLRKAVIGVDYIVHLAAVSNIPVSVEKPIDTYKINVIGTENVISLASEYNAKVIFASSAAIFYPTSSPYAYTKLINEVQLKDSSCRWTALRFFNVYGKGSISVVPKFIGLISKGETVEVYGDGKRIRDYIFVEDICRAIEFAFEAKSNYKTIEIGTGVGTDINNLIKTIEIVVGRAANVIHSASRGFDPPESIAHTHVAKTFLDFESKISLAEGIQKLIEDDNEEV